jgi:hypothetical protein
LINLNVFLVCGTYLCIIRLSKLKKYKIQKQKKKQTKSITIKIADIF